MNAIGVRYRTTLFGTSHGPFVGCTIEGLRAGTPVDATLVQAQLDRRRPGQSLVTTQRKEEDRVEFAEGLRGGEATGEPIVAMIRNEDVRSRSYADVARVPRPGHGDFPARMKYGGKSDLRGGGQLSGRMTAPLVVSGAIARQVAGRLGAGFHAHAAQIGSVVARPVTPEEIDANVERTPVRCADLEAADRMVAEIEAARKDRDSVGGIIEGVVTGLPVGVGEPFFESVEAALAHLFLSIPAVKGVDFGAGFRAASMRGSEHNDPFVVRDGRVVTETNHAGGVLGGITTGMPVTFRVVVKPTASIAKPQRSVDLERMEASEVVVTGRHDPCIVPRAVPVVENVAAMGVLDLMFLGGFL
ncbi:MAG: chorismate synthase [Euryarchaeota archaeon RBG_19FT_COMBO_69_17]|nr:MAG: chorismate synthase [Euryarchaeota archaeon RBG_19FT_COMBO_69_17]